MSVLAALSNKEIKESHSMQILFSLLDNLQTIGLLDVKDLINMILIIVKIWILYSNFPIIYYFEIVFFYSLIK